ncbi:type III secretion chaperone [Sodalis glossinidius str. 'morsitans']|nr:SycD/LcrH family type III secretion system chaperone [Sodalis glossinidius]BAE74566.1 type III secretion chaperone [Sodalis glossinidius str. 'morsitans']
MLPPSNGVTGQNDPGAAIEPALTADNEQRFARGYQAFYSERYDSALIDFSWLVMSQPWSWRAHVALAGTLMMTREYQGAMNFYGYALMLDGGHPEPVYQMGVCLQAMGRLADARMALHSAISMSDDKPHYSAVRANAHSLLNQLLV